MKYVLEGFVDEESLLDWLLDRREKPTIDIIGEMRSCELCGKDSGTHLACDFCRKTMSRAQRNRLTKLWHETIVTKGDTGDGYKCFHCDKTFAHDEITGDHYPFTKGARPDLRFDVENGVPCCKLCNMSDSPNRR